MMSSIIKSTGVNISKIYFLIDEAHNLSTTKKTVLMKSALDFVSRFIGELVVLRKMREAMRTNERLYPGMFGKDEEWAALRTILNESNDKIRKRYNFTLWDISKPEFQRLSSFIMSRYSGDIISYSDRMEIIETSPELKLNEINDAKLQVYQSGTFSPIQYYKSLYGLSRAKTLVTTPETKENQFRCYLKGPLTSAKRRRQPKMYRAMAAAIKAIHAVSPRHVLVICPSYEFVNMLSGFLKGIINPKIIHTEAPKVNIDILSGVIKYQVIPQIFVAVSSGKISEGVEIVVEGISLLSVVIFAGLPIAPPSKDQTIVKRAYMQASHNPRAADEFMRAIPLERAVRQAYGRTIRAMHDKGALVILDYRAEQYLKKLLQLEKYISLKRLNDDLTGFFEGYQTLEELRELRQVKRKSRS
ncbi:MAG: hypothetical protein IH840_08790 [Candidatus Heimdallarchaeota archaeon]|nr:hypothetical protein [Candidatus Heimdallarchaeota archaeon]